jgi:isopentenyl-diphosphate delta-isomerase type 1
MEEYIDLIDEQGNPTGQRKLKSEVHRDGDRHKTVHVWMVNPHGELLIQHRSPQKQNYPDMWDISFAGHISAGEDSLTAVIREGKEELALDVKREQLEYLFTIQAEPVKLNNGTYIDYEFHDIYLLRISDDHPTFKLQPEEVAEVKWIPWKELQQIIESGDASFVPHPEEYKRLFEYLAQ